MSIPTRIQIQGMVMELAFSIDRDGLVEDTHAAVYKQLG
jgi:hypothetical protein